MIIEFRRRAGRCSLLSVGAAQPIHLEPVGEHSLALAAQFAASSLAASADPPDGEAA